MDCTQSERRALAGARWRRRGGYTLLELTVVIVIVLLATLAAIQGYSGFHKNRAVGSAASKVAMALNSARYNAVANGFSYRVTIDRTNGEFWVDKVGRTAAHETTPAPITLEEFDIISGMNVKIGAPKVVRPEKFPPDVILSDAQNVQTATVGGLSLVYVVFRPDGTARSSAVLQFRNQNDDPNDDRLYHSVRAEAPTGTVKHFPNQRL